jgi:hypothetical protein
MNKHVFPGLALDEAKAFACVEPLHCSLFLHSNSCSLFFLSYLVPPGRLKRSKKRGAASVDLQPLK